MKEFYILAPEKNIKHLFFIINDSKLKNYKIIKFSPIEGNKVTAFYFNKEKFFTNKKIEKYEILFNEQYKEILISFIEVYRKYLNKETINLWRGEYLSYDRAKKIYEEVCKMFIEEYKGELYEDI